MTIPVPEVWHIYGQVTNNGQPFTQGNIRAFDKYNGVETYLGETGLWSNGNFTITYSRAQFQQVNPERTAPLVIIRVIDYQNRLVWESNLLTDVTSEYTYNIDIAVPPEPDPRVLRGTIKKADLTPLPSGAVEVYDIYNSAEYLLGSCPVSSAGAYRFTYTKSQFQHGDPSRQYPNLKIRVYDPLHTLLGTGSVPYPPAYDQIYDFMLAGVSEEYHISGTVSNKAGFPVCGRDIAVILKSIVLFDGKFHETELGRTELGLKGAYGISYYLDSSPNLVPPSQVSVFVEAHGVTGATTEILAKSGLYNNPDKIVTGVDLIVDAAATCDISLLTDLVANLLSKGFTEDVLAGMVSNESKLQYAAALTGIPKEEIAEVALAMFLAKTLEEKLEDAPGDIPNLVDYQIMFALVKTGSVHSFLDLYRIDSDRLSTILVSAIVQSIIPASIQDILEDDGTTKGIISEWREILTYILSFDSSKTNAGRIFKFADLPDRVKSIVLRSYAEHAHDLELFWKDLYEKLDDPDEECIDTLKFYFDIQKFADEFGPLSDAMMTYAKARGFDTLDDFVVLEKEEWNVVIGIIPPFEKLDNPDEIVEWPESVPGETDEEKRSNYARILFKRICALFPMARFRFELASADEEDIWDKWPGIKEFLAAKPLFDFVEQITPEDLDYRSGLTDAEKKALYENLSLVQRLYRLTPRFHVIDGLIKENLTSAMAIAHINTDDFVKKYSDIIEGVDEAQALHAAAVHTASQALFLMGTFSQQSDLPNESLPAVTERPMEPGGSSGRGLLRSGVRAAAPDTAIEPIEPVIPSIATLFGRQNQCLCQECQSIFSPSAYMIDLMEFLNEQVRGVLFSRRPDLKETELSCRNTNGPVAYIDLVNEILEDAVCSRSFYLYDEANAFFSYLNNRTEDRKKPVPEMSEIPELPLFVGTAFGNRGFPIDKRFDLQRIKGVDGVWYLIGAGWRYLIEKDIRSATLPFRITPFPQTGKDAQLRRIKPEHTHRGAYELLKHPPYPTPLPFSLPFYEVNEFLKLRNVARYALYHALTMRGEMFSIDRTQMMAFFEMTLQQFELIAGNAFEKWELWGLEEHVPINGSPTIQWFEYLSNAQEVTTRLGYTFDQLLDILSTYTILCKHSDLHLDDEKDDSYERGELSEILIKGANSDTFSDIARFHRLCTHLNLDVFTADRCLIMRTGTIDINTIGITEPNLHNLFLYLRVAKEFSVSPLRAATWLSGWVDNFNLGRGPASQFEQLFIFNIASPERAATWKEMLNDVTGKDIGNFAVTDEMYGGDIGTLCKGLGVGYDDLSLIACYEFDCSPQSEPDAKTILQNVPLKIRNLATLLRVADFSKALGLTIKDFYTLQKVISYNTSISRFTGYFLYECRAVLKKVKKLGISLDELGYLLRGEGAEKLSWLPAGNDELKFIINTHFEVNKVKSGYAGDSEGLRSAIEETVINELSSLCKIPIDSGRVLLEDLLYYSSADTSKSLLRRWADICSGGWNAEFYSERDWTDIIPDTYTIAPAINIVAESEVGHEKLPAAAKSARWNANLVVPETADYDISVNLLYSGKTDDAGTILMTVIDPETGSPITDRPLSLKKEVAYPITVTWSAPETSPEIDLSNLTISCTWKKIGSEDAVSTLLGSENTLTETSGDLKRFVNSAFLARTLPITADELAFLSAHPDSIDNLDFNGLGADTGYDELFSLLNVYILNAELPFKTKSATLFDIWREAYKQGVNNDSMQTFIAETIDWPEADISGVMRRFGYSYADCRKTHLWFVMNRTCGLLKNVGVSSALGQSLVFAAGGGYSNDNTFDQSEALYNALASLYTQSQWIEAVEPVRDRLRARQRDALCAYLLSPRYTGTLAGAGYNEDILARLMDHKIGASADVLSVKLTKFQRLHGLGDFTIVTEELWDLLDGRAGFINRAAIYAKYLIDVSMESSVKTTRIVQANSSIQMLVQRAVLGFEPEIELNDKIRQPWSWMKNYRLWEANRKIFLYPENWLEPEFRDDKTPLFKELESGLLQKELSRGTIEEAFKAYTSGLSDIANLEVIGAYSDENQAEKILHVVGRTFHSPHSHYYRRNHDPAGGLGHWSPWEKVDLDITADVVLPVPFRNKLYLFWPIIELKEKAVVDEGATPNNKDKPQYKDSFKYFELKLAWSEYSDGKWSAKRLSQNTFVHVASNIDNEFVKPTDIFHFRVEVKSDQIEIQVFAFNKIIDTITVKTKVVKNELVRKLFMKVWRKHIQEIDEIIKKETDSIRKIAVFSFGADNSARLVPIDDSENTSYLDKVPPKTILRHNRAEESDENQTSENYGALVYPSNNVLLKRTPELFACFPTNLSFFDNVPRPFFLQLKEKTFFFKPVPFPDQTSDRTKKLDRESTTFHQVTDFYHPLADDIVKRANYSSMDDLLIRPAQAYARDQYPRREKGRKGVPVRAW